MAAGNNGSITINYTETSSQQTSSISDLTGTTWVFNESINVNDTGVSPVREQATHYKYINFTSKGDAFNELVVGSSNGTRWNILGYNGDITSDSAYLMGYWQYEEYRTITITGGTDATDASLIAWLQANATQQEEPVAGNKISIGNLPIEKIFIGNAEVNKMTLGNIEIYSKGQPTPSGYQVTINAGSDWYGESQGTVNIYDGEDSDGTLLLSQHPANKSAFPMTFTVSSGYCYVSISTSGAFMGSSVNSSDFTTYSGDNVTYATFTIDKNGSITISVDDWDD